MTPAELHALLAPHGIRALKSRSQHFLLDETVTADMCDAAGITSGSRVLEIGPGPGILTKTLLDRGARVIAAEIDRRFSALLRERFGAERFELLECDVLALPTHGLVAGFGDEDYALISNLPYAITSATLIKFLEEAPRPKTITLMIQKEVADRVTAQRRLSSIAVFVQTLARVRKVREVPAGAFLPPPKVASAVIHIEPKTEAELKGFFSETDRTSYFALVKKAFSEPRKQLKNTLKSAIPAGANIEILLKKANIVATARPEELTVENWQKLSKLVSL
jgi:16S rRNA (adenine1518-N6/adenine1519-N6)-dimethyltransferase